ncbi:hypothetical protein ACLOJK_033629 [Asimina triloba]
MEIYQTIKRGALKKEEKRSVCHDVELLIPIDKRAMQVHQVVGLEAKLMANVETA